MTAENRGKMSAQPDFNRRHSVCINQEWRDPFDQVARNSTERLTLRQPQGMQHHLLAVIGRRPDFCCQRAEITSIRDNRAISARSASIVCVQRRVDPIATPRATHHPA